MAKILNGTSIVTIRHSIAGTLQFQTDQVNISSLTGGRTHNIVLGELKPVSSISRAILDEGTAQAAEDPRKKLIAAHTAAISEALRLAETSRLQEEAMRLEREAEAALHKARSRRKILLYVHNAIQAGLSVEDVTAGMEDGFAGYVHDMFDQVYVLTDLDSVVNLD